MRSPDTEETFGPLATFLLVILGIVVATGVVIAASLLVVYQIHVLLDRAGWF